MQRIGAYTLSLLVTVSLSSCSANELKPELAKSMLDEYYARQCTGDKPYDRNAYGSFELFVSNGPRPTLSIQMKYSFVEDWLQSITKEGAFVPTTENNRLGEQGEVIRRFRRNTRYGAVWVTSDKSWNMNETSQRVTGCLGFPWSTIQDVTKDAQDPKGATVTYSLGIGGLDGASIPAPPNVGNYVGIWSAVRAPRQGQFLKAHFRKLDKAGWTMDTVGIQN